MNTGYIRYRALDLHTQVSSQVVKRLWSCEATANHGDHFIFRTYASHYPTLIFCIQGYIRPVDNEAKGKVLLLGQTSKWCRFRASNDFKILCLTLYPSALPQIFKIPANEITNKVHDSNLVSSDELTKFCQQVIGSLCKPENINDILLDRISKGKSAHGQIPSLVISSCQSTALSNLPELTKNIFMSQRNFERKFKFYSGFTPKTFSNVARLTSAIKSLCSRDKRLSDTALEHDYFDQSHFSNEFKRHTGFQPSAFRKSRNQENIVWESFVDFFQAISICPPVLCTTNKH